MERQLHLLAPGTGGDTAPHRPARKVHRPISAKNRAVGRRGLAQARAALQAACLAPVAETRGVRPSSATSRRRSAA